MPLTARRHLRRMRGGAQSHLIEASDGRFYIVKFRNNPQHPRVLVNESVSAALLEYLEIPAPQVRIIEITREFLAGNPELCLRLGDRRVEIQPGWHFGSCYPGHPDRVAVYDFIPDALLRSVANARDFLGALVFDKWVANADGRQSIFFRGRVSGWSPAGAFNREAFVAYMIDHGFAFNGPHWDFPDGPLQGLYHRPLVYEDARSLDDFQPWLDRVVHFPAEEIDRALRQVPWEWLNGDADPLECLLEQLYRRRARVPELLRACRDARPALFPRWVE